MRTSKSPHDSCTQPKTTDFRRIRQAHVITLSGHGELEVAGGKKIPVGPGHIELVEDTTG
jgi:hypothetical protein